jgi:hypothetical protein
MHIPPCIDTLMHDKLSERLHTTPCSDTKLLALVE